MSVAHCQRITAAAAYLLDSRGFIKDEVTLRQITYFACMHRFASAVWLSTQLADDLGLTLRYMQSPINVWNPLMGESFVHVTTASALMQKALRHHPVDVSHIQTQDNVLVLSVASSPDGSPRWLAAPDHIRHHFVAPDVKYNPRSPVMSPRTATCYRNFWISTVIAAYLGIDGEGPVITRVPSCLTSLLNADQLYPSSLLQDAEFQCFLETQPNCSTHS
ncbi:unnamed protein product [Trypanosoma congolense IL3000]|uniref:WGS project CAEQ00000000 data, annotated contig 1039 n=1 Tax=Trypanosoma congolense (strain IL3000) TaxID=1068625 RepID=F9W3D1_TRYCI|nr:unnamed protein product [Trypanosoma congolense IL3000]